MAFAHFPEQRKVTELLQRSLERNRLAHGYLFSGNNLEELEAVARTLAKALNCQNPPRRSTVGMALDCCDACDACRRIDALNHPDVLWARPESKSRIISIEQMRELMDTVNLKPTIAEYKVAVIVAADRLKTEGANAFLKTLEEPPSKSILILLTTEPQRILDTIISRCLRLSFAGDAVRLDPANLAWLTQFSEAASASGGGLLARYRLLGLVLKRLASQREEIEKSLSASSPLERYEELDPRMRDKLEDELSAAIEAEYRRQRVDLIGALQWWLRDVWVQTVATDSEMLSLPTLGNSAQAVASRITRMDATENLRVIDLLQRQLYSNVQEALALEVGLLKLKL
jgi:DNA polymerase III gamma/tau subunit